jgi:hypothetical protein
MHLSDIFESNRQGSFTTRQRSRALNDSAPLVFDISFYCECFYDHLYVHLVRAPRQHTCGREVAAVFLPPRWLPFISSTIDYPPESMVGTLGLSITSFFLIFCLLLKHQLLKGRVDKVLPTNIEAANQISQYAHLIDATGSGLTHGSSYKYSSSPFRRRNNAALGTSCYSQIPTCHHTSNLCSQGLGR